MAILEMRALRPSSEICESMPLGLHAVTVQPPRLLELRLD